MIITKTPFRVSFFGGGTDYPAWFQHHGGAFLSMAIDKYCYLSARHLPPFFDHKHRIVYSLVENVLDVSQIQHPVVREVLQWRSWASGLEIHHDGDLPARSGLGSSSSFTVGLLHALNGLSGSLSVKRELAEQAIFVEQTLLGEAVGIQDQIAVAHGGLNKVIIEKTGHYNISPIMVQPDVMKAFESHLLLCFTGISRFASSVAEKKIEKLEEKQSVLMAMSEMVDMGVQLLMKGDFSAFGSLLDESWRLKRSISPLISSGAIDELYETALRSGALGGKLLGAGGGGFMLLFVPPENQKRLRERLSDSIFVPLKTDWSGSQVALFQPGGL